ncbi:MAG: DUF2634 domain-containing protein [Oscillospiraceae bacterium]
MDGFCDDEYALKQAIFLILNTDKDLYEMFGVNYGNKLNSLIGRDINYIKLMAPSLIKDALLNDDRVIDVKDFRFKVLNEIVNIDFRVVWENGQFNFNTDLEVIL